MLKPILCALTVLVAATTEFAAHAQEVAGYWTGALNGRIHLVVHLTKTSGGTYQGSIENTDNESGPVPLSSVVATPPRLQLQADQVGGHYDGTWDARQRAWIGKWTMQGQTLPLVLVHADAPPPSPKDTPRPQDEAIAHGPLPYSQRDIRFENRAAHVALAGTLTIPPGRGMFPAVVLISGTGANTRDEVSAGHRIFLVLADALTRKGIMVLRYDKRGVGGSTGDYGTATTADFASDAKAAVDWLAGQRNVDPRHIGVIGHSEGGVIAPLVAVADKRVAFVVMLAGPGVRGDKLFVEQAAEVALASGAPRSYVEKRRAFDRSLYAAVVDTPDHAAAVRNVKAIVAGGLAQKIVEPREAETLPDDVARPWMTQFLKLDPAVALRKLDVPVLALNGSLDLAVPAALNLPALRNALKHDPDATVLELPGLNHLFQDAKTGAPNEFARIPETMAPSALALIADWVRKHSGPVHNATRRAAVTPRHPTLAAARVCARRRYDPRMQIVFTKGPDKYDRMQVVRADGAIERIDCPKQRIIPHDMVHCAVESTLVKRGFLTRVRAGERADMRMRGEAESDGVERLVEVVQGDAWSGGTSCAVDVLDMYRVTCSARACPMFDVGEDDVDAVRTRMAELTAQWNALAVDQSLTLSM